MSLAHLLFSFQGRTRRLHYWLFALAQIALSLGAILILAPAMFSDTPPPLQPLTLTLFSLVLLYPATAVAVKRTNDIGWSPLWAYGICAASATFEICDDFKLFGDVNTFNAAGIALWTVLAINIVLSMVIGCVPSADSQNAHGPSPLAVHA
jgi:uncharacterized membrane protein YhaH (DUF805 family)